MSENKFEKNLDNIVVVDQEKFDQLINVFREQGKEKIHVLADFDKTLTKAIVDGQKMPSVISILRDGNYLPPEYTEAAKQLFSEYHPIEIDPSIPITEKKSKMAEWWQKHFDLLIKSGLNKKDIARVIEDPRIQLREGAEEFLKNLADKNIPLVILSSAGLGVEAITMILDQNGCLFDNIKIISNEFEYDEEGNAVGVKKPVIHVLNKDETVVTDYPEINAQIQDRENIILLGDSLEDVGMAQGFKFDNLIKIGFLNKETDKYLDNYQSNYDAVILNDGDMNFVNKLIQEIL